MQARDVSKCLPSGTTKRFFIHFHSILSAFDYRPVCRNVSLCQRQQSYSGLLSPGRSNSTYFWNDSRVQTFHSVTNYVSINCDILWSHGIRIEKEEISKVALIWYMRYDMIYVRKWYDMLTTLLYGREGGLSSSSCNLIHFVHLRKIPFPILIEDLR